MFNNIFDLDNMKGDTEIIPVFSVNDDELSFEDTYQSNMPILALKNTVLFPGVVIPITVGRDKSILALNKADKSDKFIGVLTQKDMDSEDPDTNELYTIGTIAKILRVLKMPDGSTTAILQGRKRFSVDYFISNDKMIEAAVSPMEESLPLDNIEFNAMVSTIRDYSKKIIELSPNIPNEAVMMVQNIKNPAFLINFISSNVNLDIPTKQRLLEINDYSEKASIIIMSMTHEIQMLTLKDKIESKVREDLEKQQKEYFLNQQLKTIQEELGGNPHDEEIKKLEEKAKSKKWPDDIKKTFEREIIKVKRINPQIAEYSVMLNYLELMLDLPWSTYSKTSFNLSKVQKILDRDHFGLEDVKKRILQHLAVLKLKGDMKAPILCLVGPPGVGKTSLGKSIAEALGRKYIRMSLGGLHDESEIRGHRKTYIGAMPGRIIQSIKKAGTSDPVFILDEIDKIGKDFRGDPSSALLEVLDPEQNTNFHDNYLDVDYDLSKVLFIATANSLSTIQPALLDRMEVIEVSGYSIEEKVEIAKNHLIPKQLEAHGLNKKHLTIGVPIIEYMVQSYTRESGVRSLERVIGGIMRVTAQKVAMDEPLNKKIDIEFVKEALGPEKYTDDIYMQSNVPGVAVGLAWTKVGGDILFIEVSTNKGKGKLVLTGNLGDVMKESATTALSYIKAQSNALNIDIDYFDNTDIHVHVPEGAIPKDGPSAGITLLTAILSAIKRRPVKSFLAMTGEITLRGKVLPVGGIKEKVLAAKRAGLKEVMLCEDNRRHVEQIPDAYTKGINFTYVNNMSQVIENALGEL